MAETIDGLTLMGLLGLMFVLVWSAVALIPVVPIVGPFAALGKWGLARNAALILMALGLAYRAVALVQWGWDGFSVTRKHAGIATGFFFTAWPGIVAVLISKRSLSVGSD